MKLAIVGAGMTACMLSDFLQGEKIDVTIFEKSRGCGGRASTKQTDWGQFDLGATIIPAKGAEFCGFMDSLVKQNIASQWPSTILTAELNETGNYSMKKLRSERKYYVFNHKMNGPCRGWVKQANLNTESLVTQVRHLPQKGWQLKINDTWHIELFDKIALTAPWPQTSAILKASALPAPFPVNSQTWASCWSVAVKISTSKSSQYDLVYQKNQLIQTLVRDSAKPLRVTQIEKNKSHNEEVWIAQLSNSLSDQLGKMGKQQAIRLATDNLSQVLKLSSEAILETYAHYWRYARPTAGQTPLGIINQQQDGLFAGGDWSFGVSIEAAYEAAQALKQAILTP